MSITSKPPRRQFASESLGTAQQQKRFASGTANSMSSEGVDFVRCRLCGDHRRVINGRHLSKHGIKREAYMQEFRLSPDELIAKDFRRLQSSRPEYQAFESD